ncbi:hypothetical protein [Pseudarthrobacter sulfonivorans]|uniref:hypothetical protein n=1 Tax=Pseudarthrobacter sulfonivorans TaxID=121292 RepID=UPI00285C6956|nr:hypothetical protein [Pseudarthrobacter sulfonivorans]MDR6416101.1 hypothetical protein [Pseudarthrobacter sulfonivorans]
MPAPPRITVEVPVLRVGDGPADYEGLGSFVQALRRPQGLHLTLLHVGILADFAQDIEDWTKGNTAAGSAIQATVHWLQALPELEGFAGSSDRLIVLGGGSIAGLEVAVPQHVMDYQVSLVQGLHELLDGLLVDNVDDFILSSPALGFRYPHWVPHVAVGQPPSHARGPWSISPLAVECGPSRIRNGQFLPTGD